MKPFPNLHDPFRAPCEAIRDICSFLRLAFQGTCEIQPLAAVVSTQLHRLRSVARALVLAKSAWAVRSPPPTLLLLEGWSEPFPHACPLVNTPHFFSPNLESRPTLYDGRTIRLADWHEFCLWLLLCSPTALEIQRVVGRQPHPARARVGLDGRGSWWQLAAIGGS